MDAPRTANKTIVPSRPRWRPPARSAATAVRRGGRPCGTEPHWECSPRSDVNAVTRTSRALTEDAQAGNIAATEADCQQLRTDLTAMSGAPDPDRR